MIGAKIFQFKSIIFLGKIVLVAILCIACHSTTNISDNKQTPTEAISFANTNVLQGCISNYNPKTDYFPEKTSINYGEGFEVEYHQNYKIIKVKNPWKNANTTFEYVLVQCGTPTPKGFQATQIIQVPVNTIVSLSTTHLPHLDKLGVVDKLVGISDRKQVNTASVVDKIKTGQVVEVSNNANVNVEKLLELNPDLVTTHGVGNPNIDSYPKLLEAGLKVAINAEYMESSPLGRAEWLKFTALFFNHEAKAAKIFAEIAQQYETIVAQVKSVKNRPSVFVGFNFKGTWYMPGGNSYVAQYLADAGANYLWKEDKSSGSLPLSFEKVFERAVNADYWLNFSQSCQTRKDLLAEDNRYAEFKAVKNGNLYNNNARINTTGGNDYWESGITNPHLVLSDLIKILHPEILPNHQLKYYRQLS
ncbi:ABC transporter substrate-binding protein [Brasilonema sp. UFV-L1]|uniref:ABC transporter substrate-binding protein n=1 Tax=Brasilonema sp. UFV-L1 TaxID=2234130 RepID=UPI00145ED81C|nr:ABC transporter substrate-binding protein [Brasilonema sp. UFV-L1]NMG11091.1 ABC transporter substrate-binding protein [Brasilonema sp. UFV-L1]